MFEPTGMRTPSQFVSMYLMLGAAAVAFVACEGSAVTADEAWVADRDRRVFLGIFGPGESSETVVATVGELSIHAGDVAEWLRLFPNLTVSQAVEDLVDVAVGARRSADAPSLLLMESDAQARARALAWVDGAVSWHPALRVDEAEVEAVLADPTQQTAWRSPALATTSHFLVRFGEDHTEESHGAAACALITTAREHAIAHADARLDARARTADLLALRGPMREAVEAAGFTMVVDTRIRHPQTLAGAPTWSGPASVVEPFAEAAFAVPLDTFSEPVLSQFGCHLLVVEDRSPAADVSIDAGRETLRATLAQSARSARMQVAVAEVQGRVPLRANPDAIALITASAGERLRLQQQLTSTAP